MKKIIFLTISGWLLVTAPCRAEGVLENPSFENGFSGWEVTANNTPAAEPCAIEKPGYDSEHCLKITLTNRFSLVRVKNTQAVVLDNPAEMYYLSFYGRFDNPLFLRALTVQAEYLKDGGVLLPDPVWAAWKNLPLGNPMTLYPTDEVTIGNWVRRTYAIPPANDAKAVRIALEFSEGQGSAWLDSFTLEKGPNRITPEKLLYYNPFKGSLGAPPYDNFVKLIRDGSLFLGRADRYNRLMVQQSLAQGKMEDLARAAFYLGKKENNALAEENDALLRELDALYGAYGRIYLAGTPEKLPDEFDKPADLLEKKINSFAQKSGQFLYDDATEAGLLPLPQQTAKPRPIVIDEHGRPNQLLFATYSKNEHFDMEKTLGDIKRVYFPFADLRDIRPTADRRGLDFSAIIPVIEKWQARGVECIMLLPPLVQVDGSMVMPDFFDKNWNNPEIYMQQKYKPPKMEFSRNWRMFFPNIFNPEVRESCRQVAAAYAQNLKRYQKIYVFNWEAGSPTVNGRTGGYGEVAKKEFQKYLEGKYQTIRNLNASWRTSYQDFSEIEQPLDKRSIMGNDIPRNPIPVLAPLSYEFESWINKVQAEFSAMLYREIKKNDPRAVVMSDHNDVFSGMAYDPMTVFDYSDMVSNHAKPILIDVFRSLARHRPEKTFGSNEDQWGLLWENYRGIHRPGDEKPWRNYIVKHVGKLADHDYVLQNWWYSYTRGEFILGYGSANWANPVYDLTTFRYEITGLPTGIDLLRRVEEPIRNTRKVPSRILLLIPEASFLHQYGGGNTWREMNQIHRLLFPLNYGFESSTEQLVLKGAEDLNQYDVIISPFAPYYPKGLWEKITPWIKKGGTLVCLGPCGLYDEFGFDNPASLTRQYVKTDFPVGPLNHNASPETADWGWRNGEPLQKYPVDKGSIVLTTKPLLGILPDNLLLPRFLETFRAVPGLPQSPDTPVELTLRADKAGRRCLFAVNPNGDAAIRGSIEVPGRFSQIRDLGLAGGFPVKSVYRTERNRTGFQFQLAPGVFTVFELGA